MVNWLKRALRDRYRFQMPASNIALPTCRVREATPSDFDACESIYRLNEAGHFPRGYRDHFCDWLRDGTNLVLVAEVESAVRAVGGIATYGSSDAAVLSFGMVHPGYQRQRLGTLLLLARLTALPEPGHRWTIGISTTGGSHTFFERFGFRRAGRFPDTLGAVFEVYRCHLYRADWRACHSVLAESAARLETAGVRIPSIPVPKSRRAG